MQALVETSYCLPSTQLNTVTGRLPPDEVRAGLQTAVRSNTTQALHHGRPRRPHVESLHGLPPSMARLSGGRGLDFIPADPVHFACFLAEAGRDDLGYSQTKART